MATYSKGELTNKAIIEAGRKLFLEKGYVATHCNDIAAEANVNPGLIYYHFKTKGNIAEIVYADLLKNEMEIISKLFPNESHQIRNAIELRVYWYLIANSEKYRRFIYEISLERIPPRISKDIGKDYFIEMNKEYLFEKNEEMLTMLCMCSFAIEAEMIMGYVEGYFNLSEEKLADYDIKSMYELMSFPNEKIKKILKHSKELFSSLQIKLSSGFKIKISFIPK